MFHVDPKGDTQGSLNTGDDVIVTTEGNVGIGILPEPTTPHSLTLTDGGTPATPRSPLRIEDGNQQEGRILTSDANGYAAWQDLPAGFIPGRVYGLQAIPARTVAWSATVTDQITAAGFTFTADVAGSYIFEVRWWSKYSQPAVSGYIHFYLYKGSAVVDQFEQYVGANATDISSFTVCFSFYSTAVAGDVFALYVRQQNGPKRPISTQATPAWTQSKVNVLRVN
jgi:hypothetical protein